MVKQVTGKEVNMNMKKRGRNELKERKSEGKEKGKWLAKKSGNIQEYLRKYIRRRKKYKKKKCGKGKGAFYKSCHAF